MRGLIWFDKLEEWRRKSVSKDREQRLKDQLKALETLRDRYINALNNKHLMSHSAYLYCYRNMDITEIDLRMLLLNREIELIQSKRKGNENDKE